MTLKESELESVQVDSTSLKDIVAEDAQDDISQEKKRLITENQQKFDGF